MIGTLNDGFGKSAIPRDIYISGIHSSQFLQQHFALGPDRFLFFSPHDNDGYILWYVVVILVISSGISTVIFLQLYEKNFLWEIFMSNEFTAHKISIFKYVIDALINNMIYI